MPRQGSLRLPGRSREKARTPTKRFWLFQDLSKRLEGQLEILHKQGPNRVDITKTAAWEEFIEKGGEIVCTSLDPGASLDEKLTEYGETRRDILCVVLRIHLMDKKPVKQKEEKAWSPDWIMQKLNCPVMVYS